MKVDNPRLRTQFLYPISGDALQAETSLERISLKGADIAALAAKNVSLDEALLERVIFSESNLEKFSLCDAELVACELSAAQCPDASWIRVRIKGGRLTGIDLSHSTLKNVTFEGCKLDMANFRYAKLTRVQFIDCVMTEVDFQAAELNRITYQSCELDGAEFAHCSVADVDARTSRLIDIRGWRYLRGMTIDSMQLASVAPQLALELGLKIED